jgi:Na+/phosphate symporter
VQRFGGSAATRSPSGWGTLPKRDGVILGAIATAIVQSSSAVSAGGGVGRCWNDSFNSSWRILLGANIGTTSNALLVSLKLESIGPVFIVLGAALSFFPTRWRFMGKTTFYSASYSSASSS